MVKRIGIRPSQPHTTTRTNADKIEGAEEAEAVRETAFVTRENLGSLIFSHRRPPRMDVPIGASQNPAFEEDYMEVLGLLASVRSDVLAYYVAEMYLRLSKINQHDLSAAQKRGLKGVEHTTRMLEHLNIMRSNQALE